MFDLSNTITGWRRDGILGESRRFAATGTFAEVSYEKGNLPTADNLHIDLQLHNDLRLLAFQPRTVIEEQYPPSCV
jgi:hypothetical protein